MSHDQAVHLHLTTIGGQPALVGYVGDVAGADVQSNWVFSVTLDDSTTTGSYTFTLLKPIDHPTQDAEDNIKLDFGFTATDADGDTTAPSTFHVTINDDAPIQSGATITGTAAEDDLADFNPLYPLIFDFWQGSLGTSPYDGSSGDQSHTGLLGTVPVWGNLASLVKPGADGPGEFHLVSETQAESVLAHLGPNGGTLSSHGDVINDVRMVDIPNVGEAMGFFASDGRLVFGLFVDTGGNYNFRLFDQLDHPIGDDPNTAALEAIKDTLNIDLSKFVTYTDFDKDTITLSAGTLSVNVVDDTPVVVGHEAVTANENDLANFNPLYPLVFDFWQGSLGSSPFDGATDDSSYTGLLGTVTAWGTLADNVLGGADEFGKFELVSETRANELLATLGADGGPLKSHGDVINDARMVDIPGLGEVMGFFASDGRLVFGLFVSENGIYNFRLFDQLDHAAPTQNPNGEPVADENSLNIDLSKFVTYTDYDHDTVDLGTNTFVVTVVDDIPHVIGSLTVVLDESHLNNFLVGWDLIPSAIKDLYPVEGSSGTNPNADTDFLLNTTSQQGFFDEIIGNNVVHGGADEFGKFGLVSEQRAHDLLATMGVDSKGEHIDHVKLVDIAGLGTVMGFFAGDRVVFTLTVTDAGFYDLRLFDQVDHTGANGTSLNIDLSKFVTYTDFDGDMINLGTNNLVLTVLDDAPVPVTGAQVFGTVEEEQIDLIGSVLGGDMLHGNEDTTSDSGDDHDTSGLGGNLITSNLTLGSLASLVKVGADENGTFSFDQSIRGTAVVDSTGEVVKSHGQVVTFGFSGNMLIGIANDDGDGILETGNGERIVFSVSLGDINPLDNVNNDLFTFTLLDAIDHNKPNGLSTEDLKNLDLSKAIRFTDYDGDSTGFATNSFQIKVIDDTPRQTGASIKGTVEEEHNVGPSVPEMNHGNEDVGPDPDDGDFSLGPINFFDVTTNKVSGNLGSLVSVGGDEVSRLTAIGPFYGTFSFGQTTNLPVVMSKGQQVQYALSDANGDGLNDTLTGSTADGRPVFTLTIVNNTGGGKTAGDYVFTLLDQIDHPAGGGENIANIDFSSVIRFSDYDGDTITLTNGSFSIDVIDDQPVSKGDVTASDVLDDEGQTIFVPANKTNAGSSDASGEKVLAQGGAKSLFSIGADDQGTITITGTPSFSVLFANDNGFAQAESVQWHDPVTAADGTVTLTAYSDHYATVATLVIKIDGSYTFTMSAPVVHPTNQSNEEDVSLKFKYTVTDFDKDSVTGSLTINVDDDTPKITTPAASGQLDDEAQTLFPANNNTVSGDVDNKNEVKGDPGALFTAGADGVKLVTAAPTTFSVIFKDGNGLAGTEAITWSSTGVQGPNGETKWIATSAHYDAGHPAATLIIRVDGSYSFTLNAPVKNDPTSSTTEENLTITIPFKVTDGDGDDSTQGTLTIKVNDDTPTVGTQTALTVDEEGLGGNPGDTYASTNPHDAATSLASANGTLNYSFGSDGASPTTNVTFLTSNLTALGLKSEGLALTYAWDQASHTLTASNTNGTVFTLQVTNVLTGAYTFSMSKPLDHLGANSVNSEDDITIPFQFTITDGDGDTSATATVNVTINDDAPTFTAGAVENKTVDEEGINGNPGAPDPYAGSDYPGEATTVSGGLGISWGADNGNSGAANRSLAFSGFVEGNPVLDDAGVAITSHGAAVKYHLVTSGDTQTLIGYIGNDANNSNNYVFSVTLNDATTTGTYNFTLFKNLDHPTKNSEDDISIKFNFVAQDADKDTVAGSFKVTVDDDSPIITLASVQNGGVDEDNLVPNGNKDTAPGDLADDGTLVAHGSLGVSYGADGPADLKYGGIVTETHAFNFNNGTNVGAGFNVYAYETRGNYGFTSLVGAYTAPITIKSTDGHPFSLTSVKLGLMGAAQDQFVEIFGLDANGNVIAGVYAKVSIPTLTAADTGETKVTFLADSAFNGVQVYGLKIAPVSGFSGRVYVDDLNISSIVSDQSNTIVDGPVTFTDHVVAANNISIKDSDGNNVLLSQLTSNGQPVLFKMLDALTLVAYTGAEPSGINAPNVVFSVVLSGTGSGSYDFTLKGVLDHPLHSTEDDLVFTFNYTAKDFDGDTTSSSFKVTVDDDMPVIVSPATGDNLIVNGQFTDNTGFSPLPWNAQSAPANSDIKGWHIAGNDLERNPANWFVQDPAGGGRVVDLDATPGNVSLSQTFNNLQNGQSYTLTFDAAKPVGYDATTQVYWNGQLVGTVNPNSDHFEQFSIKITAGPGTNTLEFREVGAADNGGTFLANVAMHSTNAIVNEDSLSGGNAGGLGDATGTTASASGSLGIKWGADAGDTADSGNIQDGTTANSLSDNVAALTGRAVYFTDSNSGVSGLQPSVTALVGAAAITLHSAGQEVHYQILENGTKLVGYTGTFNVASQSNWVFTVSLSDENTGQYKFNLLKPLDHPMSGSEDDINLVFGFTARDADGDTANSTLTITVDDDTPVLVGAAETVTVDETNTPFAQSGYGSLHVRMGADKAGAALSFATDGNGLPLHPAGLKSDGVPLDYQLRTTEYGEKQLVAFKVGESVDNPVFIVALSSPANPTYIFTLFQNLDHADGSDPLNLNFTIRITDGDGDFVDRTVDVTVKDSIPSIPATTEQVAGVQDDALTGGNPEPGDTKTATGTLSHNFGADENGHLSWLNPALPATGDYSSAINGNTLEIYQLQNSVNVKVFTVSLDPSTGAYEVTQLAPIHHPSGNGETGESFILNYRVTDGDNDYIDSHLKVIVGDDIPVIAGPETQVNLLTNGDFTGGSFPHAESWGHWATDGTGWQIAGTQAGQTGVQLELIESGYLNVFTSNGHPMVDLAATPGDVAISQTLNGLTTGQHYTLNFEIGASNPSSAGLEVYWNGSLVGTYHPGQTMVIETLDLIAIAGANTVTFKEIGSPDNTGTYLANVSLVQTSADLSPVFHANVGEDAHSIITLINGVDFKFGADGPGAVTFDTAHATLTMPTGTTLGMPTLSYDPVSGNLTIDPSGNFNNLSAGEIATLTVPFTVTDSDGDTKTGTYQFTITGSNDAPVITGAMSGAVTESGDIAGIDEAGLGGGLSVAAALLNGAVNGALSSLSDPTNLHTALTTIAGQVGGDLGKAIAIVWNYLDDAYVGAAPTDVPAINEAFTRLGVEYAVYLQNGGTPLLDVIGKYTADGNANNIPDRFQSLHDNLLGNLTADALLQRYGSNATLYNTLHNLITGVDADLLDRPYASGNEGSNGVTNAHAWDAANGYATHVSGTLTATDPDAVTTLTWSSGTQNGTYGTFSLDASGHWTYTLDNDRPATQALKQGDSVTDTFSAVVTDDHNATATAQVVVTVNGTNDAPMITSSVSTAPVSVQLHNVQQADETHTFEPAANLDGQIGAALGIPTGASPDTAAGMKAVVLAVQAALGGGATFADAIAQVWDFLDDNYQYYNTPVNHASVLLGLVYADYLQDGGQPLLDTIAKYKPDANADTIADRSQSLHDNLLGALDLPSIDDKFSSMPALRDYLLQQIHDAGLDGRPYYGGYQGESSAAAHTWDQDHGLLPVASGQITATDVDTDHVLSWSIDGSATSAYGTISVDQTGAWHFTAADNAATQALAAGEHSAVQTFVIKVTDEFGASDSIAVSVVLTGTNDAPVISHVNQTVINAGFEAETSYAQSSWEGQYSNGSPTGWTVSGPSFGGWFDPAPNGAGGSTNVLQMPAENGNNVLWLNDGQTATQTLGNASMGIYQLNVEVGDRTDVTLTGMPDFAVRLYAGNVLIAEKIVEHTTGDSYSWTLIKLEALVDSTTAGQPLRIELANLEELGSGGDFPQMVQVNFDNVSLSYIESRVLNPITEDDVNNAGQTVASILGGSVTDVDHNALGGIAITHTNPGNGSWQYSTDGGTNWIDVGNPSVTAALLLSSTDLVRFKPNGVHGTTPSFDYIAWDQTSGTLHGTADVTNRGGTTAFSEDIGHAVISVTDINDAPVISGTEIAARVFEAGGLNSVVTADVASDHRFEPLRNVDGAAAHAIDLTVNTEADMKTVVLNVQTALGTGTTMADAIASVWDYLDDLRLSIPNVDQAYYAPLINKATVLLGLVYGENLQNGGRPLLDVIVKYTPDSNDSGNLPDRVQSLHDNLLGAVDTPSIDDKFSNDTTLLADLKAQIALAGLTDRPIYSGNEGVTNNALGWDLDPVHGFLHAPTGQLSATDAEGDALTWSITNTSSYGTMSIDQTGKWTYVLDNSLAQTQALKEGETVVETFTATVTDSHGATDTQTITITIVGTNDAPVASVDSEAISDTSAVNAGTPITFAGHSVLANDTDIDSPSGFAVISIRAANPIGQGAQEPPISLAGGVAVAHGTYGNLTMHADGTYTYTPNADFDKIPAGQTVTDVFKYGMVDDHGASSASFLTITINGANDTPVAAGDSYTTDEDTPLSVSALVGLLNNDTDVDAGTTLTASVVSGPAHGSLTLNPNGSFVYTPDANYHGTDSFTYKANDGSTDSNIATVNLTVASVNDVPVAVNDSYTTSEDSALTVDTLLSILNNDTDADAGTTLTASLVAGPTHGSLTLNPDGTFVYTPDSNYHGTDSFTYKANDGTANSNVATVNLTVTSVNDAPTITSPGTATEAENTAAANIVYAVTATDVDGDTITYSISGTDSDKFSIDANGNIRFKVSPDYEAPTDADHNNVYDIVVHANDGHVDVTKNVSISVTDVPENLPPLVRDDHIITNFGAGQQISIPLAGLLWNESDPEGGAVSFVPGSLSANATLDGSGANVLFTVPGGASGSQTSFTYDVKDAAGNITHETAYVTRYDDPNGASAGTLGTHIQSGNYDDFLINRPGGSPISQDGGDGNDVIFLASNTSNTTHGGNGNDLLIGGQGGSSQYIYGDEGNDLIYGGQNTANHLFGGNGNDRLYTGVGGSNEMVGGGGDDYFYIQPGASNVALTGDNPDNSGGGKDHFIFMTSGWTGATISDFETGKDSIDLLISAFTGMSGTGAVSNSDFVQGAAWIDMGTSHFLYDQSSGQLYFDSDGGYGGNRTLIATLEHQVALQASDIHKI